MDTTKLKSWLIKSLVIGFMMAIYSLYGAELWRNFVVSSTGNAGVFEIGLGFAIIAFISLTLSWYLTKSLRPKREEV